MRKRIAALAAAAVAISTIAFTGTADAATAAATTAAHQSTVHPNDGHGPGIYYVWTTVNVRSSNSACHSYPSTWNCPLEGQLPAGEVIDITCQDPGESINGNPYWVWGFTAKGQYGFIASYFVENSTNKIDNVPLC
jgi:hypothetical protein